MRYRGLIGRKSHRLFVNLTIGRVVNCYSWERQGPVLTIAYVQHPHRYAARIRSIAL